MQLRSYAHCHNNKWRHKKCKLPLEDGINKLPDELLVSILSLLTITEAGRTSVLSRRWEKLWKSFTGASIVFDDYWKPQPEEQHKFISRVNQVLTSLNGPSSLDHFTVRSCISKDSLCHIDKMVESALEKRVKRLELDMLPDKCLPLVHIPEKYTFSIKQYCFYVEKIKRGRLSFKPRDLYRIAYLTSLCLKYVNVCDESIGNLISNCQFLEQISIERSDELNNLKVVGSTIKLKSLKISSCQFLYTVNISAPNLVFFHYDGKDIGLHVEKAPKLLEISTDNFYIVSRSLSNYLSQLETLTLDISFMCPRSFPCSFKLKRLKYLILRRRHLYSGLLEWTSMMESAFPFLSRMTLELHSYSTWPPREIHKLNHSKDGLARSGCSISTHPFLKVVEIIGFVGYATEVELAIHLLANSITLEKIIIDRRTPSSPRLPIEETEEQIVAKKSALRLIEEYVPPGVNFVVI